MIKCIFYFYFEIRQNKSASKIYLSDPDGRTTRKHDQHIKNGNYKIHKTKIYTPNTFSQSPSAPKVKAPFRSQNSPPRQIDLPTLPTHDNNYQ